VIQITSARFRHFDNDPAKARERLLRVPVRPKRIENHPPLVAQSGLLIKDEERPALKAFTSCHSIRAVTPGNFIDVLLRTSDLLRAAT
jgi:hypothetical protein